MKNTIPLRERSFLQFMIHDLKRDWELIKKWAPLVLLGLFLLVLGIFASKMGV